MQDSDLLKVSTLMGLAALGGSSQSRTLAPGRAVAMSIRWAEFSRTASGARCQRGFAVRLRHGVAKCANRDCLAEAEVMFQAFPGYPLVGQRRRFNRLVSRRRWIAGKPSATTDVEPTPEGEMQRTTAFATVLWCVLQQSFVTRTVAR